MESYVSVYKAAIMQIKELKDVLNGQCEIIGFTLEEVENMMCDICVDWLILTYGAFQLMVLYEILIYNRTTVCTILYPLFHCHKMIYAYVNE